MLSHRLNELLAYPPTQKPAPGSELEFTDLGAGLVFCSLFNEGCGGSVYNQCTGNYATSNALTWGPVPGAGATGRPPEQGAKITAAVSYGVATACNLTDNFTVGVRIQNPTSNGGALTSVFGRDDGTNGWALYLNAGSGLGFRTRNGGVLTSTLFGVTIGVNDYAHSVVAVMRGGKLSTYYDGVVQATASGIVIGSSTAGPLQLGAGGGGAAPTGGQWHVIDCVWNRPLDARQVDQWHRYPYSVVRRRATHFGPVTDVPSPTITSISPTSGPVGTTVTVTGTNFSGTSPLGVPIVVLSVTLNGVACSYTVVNSTTITLTVPSTTSGGVSVSTNGGTATSQVFVIPNYLQPTRLAVLVTQGTNNKGLWEMATPTDATVTIDTTSTTWGKIL